MARAAAAAQSALANLARPTAYAIGGAPVVVTWSAPALAGTSVDGKQVSEAVKRRLS